MTKEIWTVQIEVDVDYPDSAMECLTGVPVHQVENTDDYIIDATPTGIHRHRYYCCNILLPWKLIERKPL